MLCWQNKGIPIPSSGRIAIPGREGEFFEPRDLSTTPGGTIYGTTPGGTRIVYDRETLLALRNSPLAQTPPKNMAKIPGVTAPALDAPIPEDDPQSDDDDAPKGSEKNTTFEME